MSIAVLIGFGPCKRHSRNGLTAAADGLDGLCAGCRSAIAAGVERQRTYSGTKPLKDEPPRKVPNPKGGTPPGSTARKADRLARFEVILFELSGGDLEHALPAVVRKAGELVGVSARRAREYRKELLQREVSSP